MATHKESRSRLVSGCGTILKTDRLTGGYKLVKRKNKAKGTTSATGKKRGNPTKVKVEEVVMVTTTTAPAKKRGRKLGSKNKPKTMTASVPATVKKRGRKVGSKNKPKTTTMMVSMPVATKGKVGRPKGSKNKPKMARRAKKTMA
jgi:hypothetical protein